MVIHERHSLGGKWSKDASGWVVSMDVLMCIDIAMNAAVNAVLHEGAIYKIFRSTRQPYRRWVFDTETIVLLRALKDAEEIQLGALWHYKDLKEIVIFLWRDNITTSGHTEGLRMRLTAFLLMLQSVADMNFSQTSDSSSFGRVFSSICPHKQRPT